MTATGTAVRSGTAEGLLRLLPDTARASDGGRLEIGGCDAADLAGEFGGTPLIVYDEEHLRARCREAVRGFGPGNAVYASKAFLCKAMAGLVLSEKMGMDAVSTGEIETIAAAAGEDALRHVTVHGSNKPERLLERVRGRGSTVVVDSFGELGLLERLWKKDRLSQRILLRVAPGISAGACDAVHTGHVGSKFGFGIDDGSAGRAVTQASISDSVQLAGLHYHIGSQQPGTAAMLSAMDKVAEFAASMPAECLEQVSAGGGLGVAYTETDTAATISRWAGDLRARWDLLQDRHGISANLAAEPGRAIAAAAAVTLYTVGTQKRSGSRRITAVDGGFRDNMRPMLYGSRYTAFAPTMMGDPQELVTDVVGGYCESSDTLVEQAVLPAGLQSGDLLAVPITGAYGYSMASSYHRMGRPAVVFARDGDARLVIRRETDRDLLSLDVD